MNLLLVCEHDEFKLYAAKHKLVISKMEDEKEVTFMEIDLSDTHKKICDLFPDVWFELFRALSGIYAGQSQIKYDTA